MSEQNGTDDVLGDLVQARELLGSAVRLFVNAGNRSLAAGRAGTAADLFGRAYDLLTMDDFRGADTTLADVLAARLTALLRAGRGADARRLTGQVEQLDLAGLAPDRLVVLRTRLAQAASVAGRPREGAAHVTAAHALAAHRLGPRHPAPIDAIDARLTVESAGGDDVPAGLARRALATALEDDVPEDDGPDAACQALEVLGILARRRGTGDSAAHFERMAEHARAHRLPYQGLLAALHLGIDDWLADGTTDRIDRVALAATQLDASAVHCSATVVVALDLVLTGRYPEAAELVARCRADAAVLGLDDALRSVAVVRAVLAAHQGLREQLTAATTEFHELGGAGSRLAPLVTGLAGAWCALLEEDRPRAVAELDRVATQPACPYPVAGPQGLRVLLASIDDEDRPPVAPRVTGAHWNRQFLHLARAVRLGRAGHGELAVQAVEEAGRVGARYPMARHLGLRLVAEAAYRDGWGRPVDWLREAEAYFHACAVPAVAGAARSLLRQFGAPPPQHREGAEDVPSALRRLGVTVREHEVLGLLVTRSGNRAIAQRLHISHRTVEKHVASLLMKLGQTNRDALSERATALLACRPCVTELLTR